ncbi:MAG: DoxX family membrane protein [Desulfobacterales bacterium]|nr:DoxX family membrane protein [Desulfobacterales bacterium]
MNKAHFLKTEKTCFAAARIFLGAVFLYASYDKILHPQAFAEAVYNYQILPDAAVNLVALFLPWIELAAGLCLIAGAWLPGATMICALLMTAFTAALVFNEIRGLDVHCGCFSTQATHDPASLLTVLRDLFFLAVSVYLLVRAVFAPLKITGNMPGRSA